MRQRPRPDVSDGGFTIIELMMVMIVLGALAGVVLLAVGTVTSDADGTTDSANNRQCATAIALFSSRTGVEPTTNADLEAYFNETTPPDCIP